MLKAGVVRADISPKLGVQLAGYPHEKRENTGVHDPLYATALFLDNGKQKYAMVSLDLLYIGKLFVKNMRESFDYPVSFTATHTHCGPWGIAPTIAAKKEGITEDEEYLESLQKTVVELIKEAEKNTFDAEIGTAIGKCGKAQGVGGNRRVKNGLQDESVNIISVREKGGMVKAIVVNYSLHPTYLHANNTLVTADYPCYINRYFHFAEPEALVLFMQGSSGNQSSRYHRVEQSFEEAARAGTTIACEVDRCLKEIKYTDSPEITVKCFDMDNLPLKQFPSVEELEKKKIEAESYYESVKDKDYITARNAELAMFGAQSNYSYAKFGDNRKKELPMEVFTAKIDDTLIVMLQGEHFVEFGLGIKEVSPYKKTFVYGVSNGALPGYIYTEEAGKEGGYEVGNSMFAINVGEVLMENMKEIVKSL